MTEVQSYQFLILGPAAAFLKLAPIWYQVYFPIVLLTVMEIVRATINLVGPDWTLFRAVYGVLVHCGGLAILYALIRADRWVTATESAAGYAHAAQTVNQWIYYGLLVTAIFSAVMLIVRVAPADSTAAPGRSLASRCGASERGIKERTRMLHTLMLLLSVLTDYQTMTDLAHGTFTMGAANTSLLCCIGIGLGLRRSKLTRG
jgi:hypothetical protein